MQSVKEVLQSLVDDNLVDFDKIGSGNFYWALPSNASLKVWSYFILEIRFLIYFKQRNLLKEQISQKIQAAETKKKDILAKKEEATKGRVESVSLIWMFIG